MRVPIYERQNSVNQLQGGNVNAIMPAGDGGAEAAGLLKGLSYGIGYNNFGDLFVDIGLWDEGDANIGAAINNNANPITATEGKKQATPEKKKNVKINARIGEYEGTINEACQAYGVDPDLIKALIQQESGGNPNAVSPKGAIGLGQLMPKTAEKLGVTDPFDPKQNIRGCVKYLWEQLKAFGGSIEKALWAYNAGPGRVKQGKKPNETKKYIRNIMATYQGLKGMEPNKKAPEAIRTTQEMSKKEIFKDLDKIFGR